MPKLSKDQIKVAAYQAVYAAEGYDSDELSAMREAALDYYYLRPSAAPSVPGRSAVQSSDVADMVEAVTAQIMPCFENENIVAFEPTSDEDIQQATTETNAVNYVVLQENNGYFEIQSAVKDALLLRNGIIKVYLEEKVDVSTESYELLTELEYGELMQQSVADLSDVDNGVSATGEPSERKGFWDATVKTKTTERRIAVKSIDPVNFSWYADWDSIYLKECPFVAERSYPTRSELIEMGYKKSIVQSLPSGGNQSATDQLARSQGYTAPQDSAEPSQDIIECYECYMRLDADGDGVGELLKIVLAGNQVLESDPAEYVPYASGTPFLQPHRFNGQGLFDKLQSIQDSKTSVLRQMLDNQNHANNARVGVVASAVNMDDVTNSRPGGVIRMQSPDAVVPFPFTDIGPSAQGTLDYLDKIRSEKGGASLDMITAEAQIAGDTAHGVERQMTAKEQLAAMMTRTLSDTLIRTTFEMVHKAMRLYVTDPLQFRIGGQFVQTEPSQWQERDRIVVKTGLSNAERTRKKGQLEQIIQHQQALLAQGLGGTMVSEEGMYNALNDWCKTAGLSDSERYWVDPTSQEAQQAQQSKQESEQAEQAQQAELLELQKQIESRKADNNDAKVIEDSRQFDLQIQYDYWAKGQDTEAKEAELVTKGALELVKDEQKATGTSDSRGDAD